MSDPERLIQDGDDLVQAMLRAGASDGPSEVSRQKVAAGLGIATATQAAPWSAGGLFKWLGGTVVVLALVGGAAQLLRRENTPATQAPTMQQPLATPPVPAPEPTPAEPIAAEPPTPVKDAPIANAQPLVVRRPPKAATALPETRKSASTLDAEMALLDGARASLHAGRPADALRTLDGYDAQFPGGLLVPEATVVRIEALVKKGDKAGALRLGESFLRAHPDSPLAARVRSLTNS